MNWDKVLAAMLVIVALSGAQAYGQHKGRRDAQRDFSLMVKSFNAGVCVGRDDGRPLFPKPTPSSDGTKLSH